MDANPRIGPESVYRRDDPRHTLFQPDKFPDKYQQVFVGASAESSFSLGKMINEMNNARMHTGFQGLTCASPAFLIALNYARERIQMREIGQPGNSQPVAIINHPDVRRNLLWMKSYIEGMRSFFITPPAVRSWHKLQNQKRSDSSSTISFSC